MRAWSVVVVSAALFGCPAKEATPSDAAPPTATKPADAAPGADTKDSGTPSRARASTSFSGKYTVTVGSLYIPEGKDWSSVKFKNDDRQFLGEGEMRLSVDPSGRVSGSTESGPLGASVLEGASDGKTLSATIRRKDPADEGLTGTLFAKVDGDKLEGSMNLAEANASVVRLGTFTATKK